MTATNKQPSGTSLGRRIFLATALIVTLAVGAAVAITYVLGNRIADNAVRQTLKRATSVQEKVQAGRFEELRLTALLVAGDTYFSAAIIEAVQDRDIDTLLDQLGERSAELAADISMVLDPDGIVLAYNEDPGRSGEDLSGEPLVARALEDFGASGLWATDGRLYYTVVVSVTDPADLLEGFLLAAYAIDDETAGELREINATEVSYFLTTDGSPRPVANTLGLASAEELTALLAEKPRMLVPEAGAEARIEPLELRGYRWLALVRPLVDTAGERIGAVVTLASLEEQLAPFRRIQLILAAVGLVAILIALLISYVLPQRVLQPMSELAEAAQAAAEGDYDRRIAVDHNDEVGQLAAAFDKLLSELREKRDMEVYVSELARNLPDQEIGSVGGQAEVSPAEQRDVALLGVELRNYIHTAGAAGVPRTTLDQLAQDLRSIARAVRGQSGKVEAVLGHRLVASFEGARRSHRALSAAGDIIHQCAAASPPITTAVALVCGPEISGSVTWDNQPEHAVTGWSVEHLEGLLRVTRAGGLLLSQTTRNELRSALEAAGVELTEHRSTVSAVPLFSMTAELAGRFAGPEMSATQEMTEVAPAGDAAPTLSAIALGNVLGDRFEILGELGAGGMGVVYKARDRSLDELVALKMLKQDVWGDSERLERLKEELKLARKISHVNVLRTFDFGELDGIPFISMELVRGITLKQLIDQSGPLPLSAGLHLARQLCRGLAAAHAGGVLHRDIKPENLIIEHRGNVKLMDFGIAKPISRSQTAQTEPGMVVGTPHYLAPEQLQGVEPDERADLYACGVVLYEIFTGHLPFPAGGSLVEIITRKLQEDPVPPSEHWPTIPADLERIVLTCLERDREQRFADTGRLLAELEVLRA